MQLVLLTICLITCYLIGSIPFGYLIAKSKGIDIRKHGSGNIGATNVFRIIGKKTGILVFFLDFLKGILAVLIMRIFTHKFGKMETPFFSIYEINTTFQAYVLLGIIIAIIGHNYTIWLGFKGGKGIATGGGGICMAMPYVFLICILTWLAITLKTKLVSLASILAATAFPIAVVAIYLLNKTELQFPTLPFITATLVCIITISRHSSNIKKLINGTEPKIKQR